ncbi:MAG TPA: GntR family transcriptional regulator [Kaistia sp.]|nr:GntR family transcriptional regulator [Kaistia sp.]
MSSEQRQDGPADTAPGIRMIDAYERIRSAILEGVLLPGKRLSQVKIADQLGLSRTPVREALRLIEKEGLITSERGRQIVISPTSLSDLDELYALRIKLDTMTVRSTAADLAEADIAEMQDCIATMVASSAPERFAEFDAAHRQFHMVPIRLAGPRHADYSARLNEHAERYRRLYLVQPSSYQQSHDEHRAILAASEKREGELLAHLLAEHYARIALAIIAQIDPVFEPRQLRLAVLQARQGRDGDVQIPESFRRRGGADLARG